MLQKAFQKLMIKNIKQINSDHFSSAGFTFIEFLIYIAVLTIVLGSVNAVVSGMLYNRAKLAVIEEVNQNARIAMEKIGELIRNADSVEVVDNEDNNFLEITKNKEELIIRKKDRSIVLEINEEEREITSARVSVNNLIFTNASFEESNFYTVKVELDVEYYNPQKLSQYNYERVFYDTFNASK